MSHTPGDWKVSVGSIGGPTIYTVDEAGKRHDIADLRTKSVRFVVGPKPFEMDESEAECMANANLFSAAPDLLAVLREVEYACDGGYVCPVCYNHYASGHSQGCRLAAALRKAEGGKE